MPIYTRFSRRKGRDRAGSARLSLEMSGMVSVDNPDLLPGHWGEAHTETGVCQRRISFHCIREEIVYVVMGVGVLLRRDRTR